MLVLHAPAPKITLTLGSCIVQRTVHASPGFPSECTNSWFPCCTRRSSSGLEKTTCENRLYPKRKHISKETGPGLASKALSTSRTYSLLRRLSSCDETDAVMTQQKIPSMAHRITGLSKIWLNMFSVDLKILTRTLCGAFRWCSYHD